MWPLHKGQSRFLEDVHHLLLCPMTVPLYLKNMGSGPKPARTRIYVLSRYPKKRQERPTLVYTPSAPSVDRGCRCSSVLGRKCSVLCAPCSVPPLRYVLGWYRHEQEPLEYVGVPSQPRKVPSCHPWQQRPPEKHSLIDPCRSIGR